MREDVILYSLTEKQLRISQWEGVEATFSLDFLSVQIFKTKRDIEVLQNFKLMPGSIVSDGNNHFRILSISYLDRRPKYAVCQIEKIEDIHKALDALRHKIKMERLSA